MHSKRVVILQDHSDQTEALKGYFAKFEHRCEYEVVTASNGRQAATALRRRPDLILLDPQMRGLDGLALLQQIRSLDQTIPVIAVTGKQATGAVVEVLRAGVFAYVPKPYDYLQIEHLVALVLSAQFRAKGVA